jgi:hypothetical protein
VLVGIAKVSGPQHELRPVSRDPSNYPACGVVVNASPLIRKRVEPEGGWAVGSRAEGMDGGKPVSAADGVLVRGRRAKSADQGFVIGATANRCRRWTMTPDLAPMPVDLYGDIARG